MGPTRPFTHASDCKIVKADPSFEVQWQEVEPGHWETRCLCGIDRIYAELADGRVRLDPPDPFTSRHARSASTGTRPIPRSFG
jgi:hypothetical protein